MGQYHWDPGTYLEMITGDVPDYERLQDELVAATRGVRARRVLELGVGTGETTRRVLAAHPEAELVGIDASEGMLAAARRALGGDRVRLVRARLEDPLPAGPFDLVVSALCVHHLDGPGKADLFERAHGALADYGRLVVADVVIPERARDAIAPLQAGHDLPDTVEDQLAWLRGAGFDARVAWKRRDLAVLVGD